MAEMLPPLIAHLMADITQFKAGLGEATAVAKAETTASATAFNGMAGIGKAALLGVAAAAVLGGGMAVKMAGDFESATNRLVTSAGEQRANIGAVRAGLLQMAGDVGDSAMALTAAYYQASSAGFNFAHGGLDVVRAAAEGAKAEGADLAKVTDAVTSAMVDYHEPASAAAMVTTKMVAAVGQGKTTFEGMTGSLHSVLPVASAAHISLSDILGDVASMTVHGMSADQVTQDLAHTIEHLQKTTAPQNKELALLGINAQNLSSDLGSKGLSGTLMEIDAAIRERMGPDGKVILQMQQALHGLPPEVQAMGQAIVNGTASVGDLTKATKGLSVEQAGQVRQFESLMTSTHGLGSNQKSGAQIAQSYSAALAAATGDATTLQVALMLTGENSAYTTGAIKAVAGATTEAGNHVAGWASIQATFNQRMDRMTAGLGAVAITVGTALIPYVERAMDGIAAFTTWLSKNQQVAIPLAVAIGGVLVVAIGAYIVSMAAAAVATIAATWPLLLIIAAVALVAVGIYELITHWSQIVAWLKGVWHAAWMEAAHPFDIVKAAVTGFVGGVVGAIGGFFSHVGSLVSAGWQEFARHPLYWIGFLLVFIPAKLGELLIGFGVWIGQMIVAVGLWANQMEQKALMAAANFVVAVWQELQRLPGQTGELLSRVIETVARWAGDMIPWGAQAASQFGQAIWNELQKLPGQMAGLGGDIAQGVINGLKAFIPNAIQAAKDFISGMISGANAAAGNPKSPAPATIPLGLALSQGVEHGVRLGTPSAQGAMAGLITGMAGGGSLTTTGGVSGSVSGVPALAGMDDTNDLLAALYRLLDERLPRTGHAGFSNRAYGPA